jgi:hypothetical protein
MRYKQRQTSPGSHAATRKQAFRMEPNTDFTLTQRSFANNRKITHECISEIYMYRELQQAPCLAQEGAAEIVCARNQTTNNAYNREIRDFPVRLAAQPTPHLLYTITLNTNPPVLPTIPKRHTPETHENTITHKTHFPQVTHHPTTLLHPPYSHPIPYITMLTIIS